MSRTDLDATTLANSLRMKAGDGSIEWVSEPIQASVLLDIADMLDEVAKLRDDLEMVGTAAYLYGRTDLADENAKLRKRITEIELDNNQLSFINDVYLKFAQLVSDDNDHLRELVRDMYRRFHGVVIENWSYSTEDFDMLACRLRELGVEVAS